MHGNANKKNADEDGLVIVLCRKCHQDLHDHGYFDEYLQELAQVKWMKFYSKTKEEFRERYKKNLVD